MARVYHAAQTEPERITATPRPISRRPTSARGLQTGALVVLAEFVYFVLHPVRSIHRIRSGPARPTYKDLARMSPSHLAEWHRTTGIEAHVLMAIAEAERSGDSQKDPAVPAGLGRPQ